MVRNSSSNAAIIPIERNACRSFMRRFTFGLGRHLGARRQQAVEQSDDCGRQEDRQPGVTPTAAAAIQAPVAVREVW
jgi:hypothetical protein